MKKKNPPNKSPLFKILGEVTNKEGNEIAESYMLDSIGCTANVVLLDED